ncbi:Holliday junction resolvase RuvX [Myroides odoratus]|uniref:Holliday junction resolvase RuvX n=1 Tax=Myroides odoratus TaxID=256 RepID=UPI0039AFF05F
MGRLLAIDFGQKRTGIAVTDELQLIASGLTTVNTTELLSFLKNYFQTEKVEKVIIGEPKRLNNEPSEVTPVLNAFVEVFRKTFPTLPVERIDERFTSKMAFQAMIDSGLKKKQRQNKALIDEIAATIILQDYMTQNRF